MLLQEVHVLLFREVSDLRCQNRGGGKGSDDRDSNSVVSDEVLGGGNGLLEHGVPFRGVTGLIIGHVISASKTIRPG